MRAWIRPLVACGALVAAAASCGSSEEDLQEVQSGLGGSGGEPCRDCTSPPGGGSGGAILLDASSDRVATGGMGGSGAGGEAGSAGTGGQAAGGTGGSSGSGQAGSGGATADQDSGIPDSSTTDAEPADAAAADASPDTSPPADAEPPEDATSAPEAGEPDAGIYPPTDASPSDGQDDSQGDMCSRLDPSKPYVLYLSADDSNSMASPVIARRLIRAGRKVPASVVRTYEFLNYYRIEYPYPAAQHVRVVPQMRQGGANGEYVLQVGIQAEHAQSPRRPMNITLALDNTGSMQGDPLWLEKKAIRAIAGSMQAGDHVSIVAWNTAQWVLLDNHLVTGPNDPALLATLNQLSASGTTDLHSGLVKAYDLARKSYLRSSMNRVVLITDGIANVGVTDADMIAIESHNADGEGIYLVGVGVGDGLNDELMDTVTDKGRGAYVYLDSEAEASLIFGPRFDETMEVAVRDVRLELSVPWYFTLETTSAEQSSTNPQEVDPQYLAPNDAVVLHNTFIPCSPSIVDPSDTVSAKATYALPLTQVAGEDTATTTVGELLAGDATQLRKGAAIVAWAETLKRLELISDPVEAGELLEGVEAAVAAAAPGGGDADLAEIAILAGQYKAAF